VVDDAMKFIEHSKEKLMYSKEDDDKELEDEQEEQAGEITTTTNQVFEYCRP
jgi:hypothetical protein